MPSATRTLSTAEERRASILEAAIPAFAAGGYHATATAGIARDAGISQAYLFRLYPTKLELFIAVCGTARKRMVAAFSDAAARARAGGLDPIHEIGCAYIDLVHADPDVLRIQLHAQAAATEEPEIGISVRRTFAELVELVRAETGAGDERLQQFFAAGMLINVMTAIGADQVDEPWARALVTKADPDGD